MVGNGVENIDHIWRQLYVRATESMEDTQVTNRNAWTTAIVASGVVTAIGLLVASMTIVDMSHGRVPARTIWGVLVVVAGYLSPVIVGLLVLCKSRFAGIRRPGVWIYATVCSYFLALSILMFLGANSSTVVLPFPFVPALSIGLDDNAKLTLDLERDSHGFLGGTHIRSHSGRALAFDGHWRASQRPGRSWLILGLLPRKYLPDKPGGTIAKLTGTISSRDANEVTITFDLTVSETIQLRVSGLENAEAACGKPEDFDPTHIAPGRYQVTITGSPKGVRTARPQN